MRWRHKGCLLGRLADAGAGISSNGARVAHRDDCRSPAKCKAIAKFADDGLTVLASMGHVRTLRQSRERCGPPGCMDFELVRGAGAILKGIGAALSRALLLLPTPTVRARRLLGMCMRPCVSVSCCLRT